MICFKCGHADKHHAEWLYPDENSIGCKECWRSRTNRSTFCKHQFEGNLEYLERKEKQRELLLGR